MSTSDQTPRAASDAAVTAAADRLFLAFETAKPCAPVRDLIGPDDASAAYRVQERLVARRLAAGAEIVGRKIGATSEAVQAQPGVGRPTFGVLLDDMAHASGDVIPLDRLIQPKVQAEVAFVLAEDLADGPLDDAQVRASIAYAVAALEIVDSRILNWDISFADTVADNASCGLFVLGDEPCTLAEVDPAAVRMSMMIDGEEASTGAGADCLGDPVHAAALLAREAHRFGRPLRSGQVVLSGALGPVRMAHAGAHVEATITGLGSVSAHLGARLRAVR
ncbi:MULTISPECIES: 2-keto-4-pentenoate hydratase [unclassified Nocardioides]|uniref:2-keto-4-pentenoate hydratase n=1 Tax=unclassified Nocardioides TaxID=2615069 RepID=UPI00361B7FF1